MTTESKPEWTVDKKIPIALIIAMVLQTAGFGWWAGATSQRLADLEKRAEGAAPQIERLVRVETKMDGILDSLKELKADLKRMPPT